MAVTVRELRGSDITENFLETLASLSEVGLTPDRAKEVFRERLTKFLAASTGSSTRITRAILIDSPLSIDRGEVTDKGSINQRAVLDHRSRLIEELYSPTPAAHVITL